MDMRIKKIMFYSVPRKESDTCSCCGKSISNIYYVTSVEGELFKFGTTCFHKVMKDRLKSFQAKEMNKALKSIKCYCEHAKEWETMTEEKYSETHCDKPWENYEDITTFEQYKSWMLTEFFPYRLSLAEKTIEKFSKIDF